MLIDIVLFKQKGAKNLHFKYNQTPGQVLFNLL